MHPTAVKAADDQGCWLLQAKPSCGRLDMYMHVACLGVKQYKDRGGKGGEGRFDGWCKETQKLQP